MALDSVGAIRAQLTFEQQQRFDSLYSKHSKKNGVAMLLSMPVLGTFGLQQFYLGNPIFGIISILFSWTLIPTFFAFFEAISGNIKHDVAFTNIRIAEHLAKRVVEESTKEQALGIITPEQVAVAQQLADSLAPLGIAEVSPVEMIHAVPAAEPVAETMTATTPATEPAAETMTATTPATEPAAETMTATTPATEPPAKPSEMGMLKSAKLDEIAYDDSPASTQATEAQTAAGASALLASISEEGFLGLASDEEPMPVEVVPSQPANTPPTTPAFARPVVKTAVDTSNMHHVDISRMLPSDALSGHSADGTWIDVQSLHSHISGGQTSDIVAPARDFAMMMPGRPLVPDGNDDPSTPPSNIGDPSNLPGGSIGGTSSNIPGGDLGTTGASDPQSPGQNTSSGDGPKAN